MAPKRQTSQIKSRHPENDVEAPVAPAAPQSTAESAAAPTGANGSVDALRGSFLNAFQSLYFQVSSRREDVKPSQLLTLEVGGRLSLLFVLLFVNMTFLLQWQGISR